jgi:hypothetical protein
MKEKELRTLIRESNFKPVRLCMDDGKKYTISHPDFGFVADGAVIISNGPGHEIDGAGFVICYFEHISRVEQLKAHKSKAA